MWKPGDDFMNRKAFLSNLLLQLWRHDFPEWAPSHDNGFFFHSSVNIIGTWKQIAFQGFSVEIKFCCHLLIKSKAKNFS